MELLNRVITGISAAPGKVQGKILIVNKEKDLDFLSDDNILVISDMNIKMFPLAKHKAQGFIAEQASITSHVATIAREAGKPCVVQATGVKDILKNGMMVELNGDAGTIVIL